MKRSMMNYVTKTPIHPYIAECPESFLVIIYIPNNYQEMMDSTVLTWPRNELLQINVRDLDVDENQLTCTVHVM